MAKFGGKQWILTGIIILCALFIFIAWWEGPTGPGGKNRYGVLSVSWKAGEGKISGTLKVNLDRSPQSELQGGEVTSVKGVVLGRSATATTPDARAASGLLPEVLLRARIAKADAGARTLEFLLTPPVGWPAGIPLKGASGGGWPMAAPQKKGKDGRAAGALGFLQIVPGGGPSPS